MEKDRARADEENVKLFWGDGCAVDQPGSHTTREAAFLTTAVLACNWLIANRTNIPNMPNETRHRKKKRETNDYTKEPAVRWFIYLIILVAAVIIIRTLTADRVNETVAKPVGSNVASGQFEKPIAA